MLDLGFEGKTALITGSSAGIGKGCAEMLAEAGCNVIVSCRGDVSRAQTVADEIAERFGVQTLAVAADVSEEAQVEAMFDKAHETFETIDFLINNVGGAGKMPDFGNIPDFVDSSTDDWDATFKNTVYSAYWCSRRFAKDLIAQGKEGAILNVTSKSAVLSTSIRNQAYASAKMAVIGLTRSCAKELTPKGIRVNCIIPGYVKTERTYPDGDERTEEKRKMLPTGKFADVWDMGYAAVTMLSPLGDQISGEILDCTGGTLV